MMVQVREIRIDELDKLLELYKHLNPDDPVLSNDERLKSIWNEIIENPDHFCLVIEEDNLLVSSCIVVVIKNLTRNARPYALIENVITHENYRKQGFGTAIIKRSIEIAKEKNCYKVMLMTSRKKESTLRFYESAGFLRGEKTAFVVRM
jgi:ribosomal protein S18 acetylase RimI-like enzyme